jgi:hypothetical protein
MQNLVVVCFFDKEVIVKRGMDGNLITSCLYGEVGWVWEVPLRICFVWVAVMEEVSPFVVDEIFLVDSSAT